MFHSRNSPASINRNATWTASTHAYLSRATELLEQIGYRLSLEPASGPEWERVRFDAAGNVDRVCEWCFDGMTNRRSSGVPFMKLDGTWYAVRFELRDFGNPQRPGHLSALPVEAALHILGLSHTQMNYSEDFECSGMDTYIVYHALHGLQLFSAPLEQAAPPVIPSTNERAPSDRPGEDASR